MNAVSTPGASAPPAARRSAKLGWRRVNQPAFLEALQQDKQISPEFAVRAEKLYRQEAVHVLPGLLRLNAIAEAPLYRSFALHAQVRLIDDSATDLASLSAQARAGAEKLGLSTDWLSLKGALVFEEEAPGVLLSAKNPAMSWWNWSTASRANSASTSAGPSCPRRFTTMCRAPSVKPATP